MPLAHMDEAAIAERLREAASDLRLVYEDNQVSRHAQAVLISGGGAVSVLDESALRVGGSTLGRDSVEYRAELSEELGTLYRARARLLADASTSEELRSKVLRELERLELEALMDALSGGAVGRWQAGRQASGIEE